MLGLRIQRQMMLDLEAMRRNLALAIAVQARLNPHFAEFFFARKMQPPQFDSARHSLPTREVLMEALATIGWTPAVFEGLDLEVLNEESVLEPVPLCKRRLESGPI